LVSADAETIDLFTESAGQGSMSAASSSGSDVLDPAMAAVPPDQIRELLGESVPELVASLEGTGTSDPVVDLASETGAQPAGSAANNQADERDETVSTPDASPPERGGPRGHTGDITCVAFAPDGASLATASWDKTVKVWQIGTGQERTTLRGH